MSKRATGRCAATTSTGGSAAPTDATTMPPESSTREATREAPLLRFDRVERTVHWVNATLFGVLMLTGAALYAGPISTLVGNRELVRSVHVWTGVLLPLPLVLGVLGRRGRRLRTDLGRLN